MVKVGEEGQYVLLFAIFRGIDSAEMAFAEFEAMMPKELRIKRKFNINETLELKAGGMKVKEIAKVYNVKESSLWSYISRAKKVVR